MNKKCIGCGSILQSKDVNKEGYIKDIDNNLCERCFRIRNYNDYKTIVKSNEEFFSILDNIKLKDDLILLVVDLFNIPRKLSMLLEHLNNNIILILTKRDVLPKSVKDEKLLDYFNKYNFIDKLVISSNKNYNFDELMSKINLYKKSKNVYVVGYTNAGKSTMLNKIIYNYTDLKNTITTSILPSTTLNSIEVKINDNLMLIDTPGIISNGSMYDYLEPKVIKSVIPSKEIRPITYQIKSNQYIRINDFVIIESDNNNITLFVSNKLNVIRLYKKPITNLNYRVINVKSGEDIVINGLGFIKVKKDGLFKIYIYENIEVFTRKSLI